MVWNISTFWVSIEDILFDQFLLTFMRVHMNSMIWTIPATPQIMTTFVFADGLQARVVEWDFLAYGLLCWCCCNRHLLQPYFLLVDSFSAYPSFNGSEYKTSQTCYLASRLWLFLCAFTLARKGSLLLYVLWCLIRSHLPLACTGSGALANIMMQWQGFTGWAPLAAAGVISVLGIIAVSSAFNENVGNSSSSIWRPLVQAVQSLHGVNSFWLELLFVGILIFHLVFCHSLLTQLWCGVVQCR